MASGSGKNQDDNQTKEPVDVLREESNAAAAATAAAAVPPRPAPPSERLQERALGKLEAGDQNPSAAAAAVPPPSAPPSERLQERAHGQLEAGGQNPSAAAAAVPPPSAPPSERLQERAHGQPEAGGQNPSAAAAAEAADASQRKGKGIVAPFWRSTEGDKPSTAREPRSASGKPPRSHRARASKDKKPLSPAEVVESGMMIRNKWRATMENRIDLKETFDDLMLESGKIREMEEKDEPEKDQVKSPAISKKSHWRKFLDRIGIPDPNSRIMDPDVSYETIPMPNMIIHYNLLEMVAGRGVEFDSNALNLQLTYSKFRPVRGDGECFYRSFIFSYLEQVLDRHDTHEEHRLLVAVKEVARQHARLGWASEFSRSHKAFNKLIKKVMKWKKHSRWKRVPTTYRKEKLLRFFNSNDRRNDIYAFLRFVAAIWMCSHNEDFEPIVPELNKKCTLKDWCFREVIPEKVFTDHVPIVALVTALGVPLRVESLFQAVGQDLYTGQGSHDDVPRSTSWPSHPHQIPPDHEVPRVTVLYTQAHYDIIYPGTDFAVSQHFDEAGESPNSDEAHYDIIYQGGSCSGEIRQMTDLRPL